MKTLTMILTLLAFLGLRASGLELQSALPDQTVRTEADTSLSLREAAGKGYALIYFYPKADTPGCTAQACSLRDAYADLQKHGVTIFGVSADGVQAQRAFREKYNLPFHLLADPEAKLIEAFAVPKAGRFAKRQAFLFKEGVLIWKDESASTAEQAADIQKVLEKTQKEIVPQAQ